MCAVNLQDNVRNWFLAAAVGDSRTSVLHVKGTVCGYAAVLLVQRIWPRRGGRARRSANSRENPTSGGPRLGSSAETQGLAVALERFRIAHAVVQCDFTAVAERRVA